MELLNADYASSRSAVPPNFVLFTAACSGNGTDCSKNARVWEEGDAQWKRSGSSVWEASAVVNTTNPNGCIWNDACFEKAQCLVFCRRCNAKSPFFRIQLIVRVLNSANFQSAIRCFSYLTLGTFTKQVFAKLKFKKTKTTARILWPWWTLLHKNTSVVFLSQ